MDVGTVDCLVRLGFSQTEAKVYCAMVSEEKMNGYQIAKLLGTSRSSVYAALAFRPLKIFGIHNRRASS